jgi:hypothetical protein
LKVRFDAGTDVAMIGAWDAQRGAQPFTAEEFKQLSDTLDADATRGHIFVLHTGADGGAPVDVYVDEPIPDATLARLTLMGDECVLALPSGSLIVDGVEHYRARKPDVGQADRAVSVPAGEYLLRCYTPPDEKEATPQPEQDVPAIIGAEDLRYYERVTRGGCLTGALLLLLFPALLPFVGWKVAFPVTLGVVITYFSVRERLLRRNERFARLREQIVAFRLGHQEAAFVFELRRIEGRTGRSTITAESTPAA